MTIEKFPIEASHILMFARAVGDDNPVYASADYAAASEPGGIVAPPTFMQASAQFDPDYFLRPKPGRPWFGSGKGPTGIASEAAASATGRGENKAILHAEQHFEYHRHPLAGDVLTATTRPGKQWEKEGKRSGKLVFTETITEYRDADGELVVTATGVGVTTERPVDQ